MRLPLLTFVVALLAWVVAPSRAYAETRIYTLAIGNNAAPSYGSSATSERLPTLRFADDDAAAIYTLFAPTSREAELLTILDPASQTKFPDLAARARVPTLVELRRIVGRWKATFEADRRAGHDPVFVLFFSGHGSRDPDRGSGLVMADGPLSQAVLYDEILAALPARYVHLLIDACYAESVVRPRDAQASAVDLAARDLESFAAKTTLARFPHVGAVVAASTSARTFEWDVLERGVFTHGLLSGLRGAADVNGDRRIEYSEIDAFLSAANRGVTDPRARLSVVMRPPAVNRRVSVFDLPTSGKQAILVGAPAGGRFYLEDAHGNRVLDAHVEPGFRSEIAVGPGRFFVRVDPDREARLDLVGGERIELASLVLANTTTRSRGSVEGAMQAGFFATAYGPSYYRAFVDGREETQSVSFGDPTEPRAPASSGDHGRPAAAPRKEDPSPSSAPSSARRLGWITLAGGGVAAAATGVFGGLTLAAKSDYDATTFERPATEARDRFETYRTLTITGAAVATVLVGASLWLLVRDTPGPGAKTSRPGTAALRADGALVW